MATRRLCAAHGHGFEVALCVHVRGSGGPVEFYPAERLDAASEPRSLGAIEYKGDSSFRTIFAVSELFPITGRIRESRPQGGTRHSLHVSSRTVAQRQDPDPVRGLR